MPSISLSGRKPELVMPKVEFQWDWADLERKLHRYIDTLTDYTGAPYHLQLATFAPVQATVEQLFANAPHVDTVQLLEFTPHFSTQRAALVSRLCEVDPLTNTVGLQVQLHPFLQVTLRLRLSPPGSLARSRDMLSDALSNDFMQKLYSGSRGDPAFLNSNATNTKRRDTQRSAELKAHLERLPPTISDEDVVVEVVKVYLKWHGGPPTSAQWAMPEAEMVPVLKRCLPKRFPSTQKAERAFNKALEKGVVVADSFSTKTRRTKRTVITLEEEAKLAYARLLRRLE